MTSTILFPRDVRSRSNTSGSTRWHPSMSTTLYWHDNDLQSTSRPHWAPLRLQTTKSSSASMSHSSVSFKFTASSPTEENGRGRLVSKSSTGLNSLWTSLRSKSNDPHSKRQKQRRPHSTSSVGAPSLDVRYSSHTYLQDPYQFSHSNADTRPDLSSLVPDYLDEPPPYSSPVREGREVIDWKAHFDNTPLPSRTIFPYTSPAIQDVRSPTAPVEGVWDRVARRVGR